jgi:hypothetical protein
MLAALYASTAFVPGAAESILGPGVVPGLSECTFKLENAPPGAVAKWQADANLKKGILGDIKMSNDNRTATIQFKNVAAAGKLSIPGTKIEKEVSVVRVGITNPEKGKPFTGASKVSHGPSLESPPYKLDGQDYNKEERNPKTVSMTFFGYIQGTDPDSITANAEITLQGTGQDHIVVGFIQHAEQTAREVYFPYGPVLGAPIKIAMVSSSASTAAKRQNLLDLDEKSGEKDRPWYNQDGKGLITGKSGPISMVDAPRQSFPLTYPKNKLFTYATGIKAHESFTLDVAAETKDTENGANKLYFRESTAQGKVLGASWSVDYTGTIPKPPAVTKFNPTPNFTWVAGPTAGVQLPERWSAPPTSPSKESVDGELAIKAIENEVWVSQLVTIG